MGLKDIYISHPSLRQYKIRYHNDIKQGIYPIQGLLFKSLKHVAGISKAGTVIAINKEKNGSVFKVEIMELLAISSKL